MRVDHQTSECTCHRKAELTDASCRRQIYEQDSFSLVIDLPRQLSSSTRLPFELLSLITTVVDLLTVSRTLLIP